ncbi:probable LRR receptor-like serine/threonine-protein kinase At2g16250 [Coffea arabica]|uniref:Probable LRR receptor-like serine/threonine-protein kinase At2g16250 n=1 Tax=Coffea arabica TaxID=13443 RepID=A0ABM4VVE6_COFAR
MLQTLASSFLVPRVMDGQFKVALFSLLLFNFMQTEQVLASSGSERWALLELRASLGIRARYWPKKVEPCLNWTGIECLDGRVTGISLSGIRRTRVGKRNPQFAIYPLSNLTSLSSFNASGFLLPGPIPEWLGQRLATLQVLDLRSCSIYGSIPDTLGSLFRLNSLYLSENTITGTIPATLGKLNSLSVLDLSKNLLTGPIPSAISALRNLSSLDLSSNFLSGAIPTEIGSLSSLKFLRLHNNSFSSSVPAQLGNLSALEELDLGYNFLSGPLPEDLGRISSLQKLLIGNNELEGALPARILLDQKFVEFVVLRNNKFDGKFPDVLRSVPHLLFLDISENNFTGELPNLTAFSDNAGTNFNFSNNLFYGNVPFEIGGNVSLDLSNNFLKGLAPTTTKSSVNLSTNCFQSLPDQRSIMDCQQFYAKRGLHFDGNNVPESPEPPISKHSKKKNKLTFILVGTFGGLGCILILGVALAYVLKVCNKRTGNGRGTAEVRHVSVKDSRPPPQIPLCFSGLGEEFTYEQVLHATNNFSETNLIKHGHSGDIFRGTLEGGNLVAIKRVDLQVLKKGRCTSELDLFDKINHPRLVQLIGHCLELENEKILVYKYMPNGDLSNSFYRVNHLDDDCLQSLDWITRLKIAIGAAEALSYLHHECNPPLVHRDIQASSILLDDQYDVRLGSLSEVCAQGVENSQQRISRMFWMAQTPDKGPSGPSASCAYDVYCFGKLLLGLVSGKLDICNFEDEGSTNEWLESNLSYISIHEKEQVGKIIDQSLIIDDDLLEEVWAVAIVAKSCLNPKPSRRPLMRHILRALENPFKIVREENFSSGRLRTTSSRSYWTTAFFGSWHHSSSESASFPGQTRREGASDLKQTGRAGSHGSGMNEYSSSHKRSSSEIFPEPVDIQDLEKQDEN